MIIKIVRLEYGFLVHYASGRIHTFYNGQKLPLTVKKFMDFHEMTVEKYGDYVAAIVWK